MFDSELNIMEIVWENEGLSASHIVKIAKNRFSWARATTYTVISKCIEKGYLKRKEPGFKCFTLISREDVRKGKVQEVIDKVFGGSVFGFFSAFAQVNNGLTELEKKQLKDLIDSME